MAEVQATDFDIAHVVRDPSAGPMQAALAICTNGLLFAAFHSTAWPSPIPLLLVGVALAWVRYRTSSLIGSVSIHALFNAVSAIALFWKQALAS
jgi:membrane protease YdiL (CAAX protease family)